MKKENATPERGKLLMRTYLTSLLSLLLCVTMLLGTTYAWFTSEVTTAGNEIYVGTLKVGMVDENGETLLGKGALFGNTASDAFRWEPGATQVETVKIVNLGDLSFHYGVYLSVVGADTDAERADLAKIGKYIEVYTLAAETYTKTKFTESEWNYIGTLDDVVRVGIKLAGGQYNATGTDKSPSNKKETAEDVATVTIAMHMKEEADDLTIMGTSIDNVGLKLIASQMNAEKDGFNSEFDSPINRADKWDGSIDADGLAANTSEAKKTVDIYTSAQLAALAEKVNAGTTYAGYTVRLQSSLNLADKAWTPIGLNADEATKVFKGTFDGQNYTIYNLKVTLEPAYRSAGLFGATQGTLKNFTVDGANIQNTIVSSNGKADNGTAVVAGSTAYGATITNVHVKNATVTGNRYLAGIVGYMDGTVEFCTVDNLTVTATPNKISDDPEKYDNGDKVGGIVGYVNDGASAKIVGCKVTNSTLNAFRDVGGIAGAVQPMKRFENNYAENITVTYVAAPGAMDDKNSNANGIVGRALGGYVINDTNTSLNVTLPAAQNP